MKNKKNIIVGITTFSLLTSFVFTTNIVNPKIVSAEETNSNDKLKEKLLKEIKEREEKEAKEKAEKEAKEKAEKEKAEKKAKEKDEK